MVGQGAICTVRVSLVSFGSNNNLATLFTQRERGLGHLHDFVHTSPHPTGPFELAVASTNLQKHIVTFAWCSSDMLVRGCKAGLVTRLRAFQKSPVGQYQVGVRQALPADGVLLVHEVLRAAAAHVGQLAVVLVLVLRPGGEKETVVMVMMTVMVAMTMMIMVMTVMMVIMAT